MYLKETLAFQTVVTLLIAYSLNTESKLWLKNTLYYVRYVID